MFNRVSDTAAVASDLLVLWTDAMLAAGSMKQSNIRFYATGRQFTGVQGTLRFDLSQAMTRFFRVGQFSMTNNNPFFVWVSLLNIVTSSVNPIAPQLYSWWLEDQRQFQCDFTGSYSLASAHTTSLAVADVIRVGLMHSFTGNLSSLGRDNMFYGEWMAIQEINEAGGVMGKPVW